MSDDNFAMIGPIMGFAITTVSCIGCVCWVRIMRKRRWQQQQMNIPVTPPQQPQYPVQVIAQPPPSYPYPYPVQQQQPYVMGYSQPLAPVGYYPQPSAPLAPNQGPYSV